MGRDLPSIIFYELLNGKPEASPSPELQLSNLETYLKLRMSQLEDFSLSDIQAMDKELRCVVEDKDQLSDAKVWMKRAIEM